MFDIFDFVDKNQPSSFERFIACSVLAEAIRDYEKFFVCSKKKRISNSQFNKLINWFLSIEEEEDRKIIQEQGHPHLYTFQSICDILDINKDLVLKKIGIFGADDLRQMNVLYKSKSEAYIIAEQVMNDTL